MKFKFLNLAFSSFHNLFRTQNLFVKPGMALGWFIKIVYSTKSNFKIIQIWQDKNTTPKSSQSMIYLTKIKKDIMVIKEENQGYGMFRFSHKHCFFQPPPPIFPEWAMQQKNHQGNTFKTSF